MRVGDLIGASVAGPDGTPRAVVTDIRAIGDGPPRGLTGHPTLRVDGLILSRGHTGSMLGYDRRTGNGPALVAAIVRWLHRDARYADWTHVTDVQPHRIQLDVDPDELPKLI
jgi:hypothetical protein